MEKKKSGEGREKKIFGEEEYVIGRGEEKQRRKRRKILGEGKYLVGEGEGKGGRYLEKENVFFSRGEGKGGK